MRNSGYRVGLVGFTSSEHPVYSETAVVNFATKGAVSPGGETDPYLVKVGVSAVVVVAVVVLILRRKLPCCKRMMNRNCLQDCTKRKKVSSGQGDSHERLDSSSRPSYPLGSATIDTTGKTSELKVNDIEEQPTMGKTKEPMGGVQPTSHQVCTVMDDTDDHEVPITVPLQEKRPQIVVSDEVVEPLHPSPAGTVDETLYEPKEEST